MKKRKLFIGNLDFSVTAKKLRDFLSPHGTVINVKVMEGKGYAFVEMGTEEQAQKIQRTLGESIFEGRKLLIDGVPGTRRPERNTNSSVTEQRERKPIGAIGKKPGHGPHRDNKNASKPEYKPREAGDRPDQARQDQRPVAKTDNRPHFPPGQKLPKSVPQTDNVHQNSKPGSHTLAVTPVTLEKRSKPDAGKKPESQPQRKQKKSRVPVWVKEKRSSGNKSQKNKY
ncbi:MAG: hypothetical protein GXY48_05335 [Methanomicrobiales archaeon]|nr:hypothetical protein [Methanomicrobiales archaeon]